MRSLARTMLCAAAVLLLVPAASFAAEQTPPKLKRLQAPVPGAAAKTPRQPLAPHLLHDVLRSPAEGASGTGPCDITGYLLNLDGTPAGGQWLNLRYRDGDGNEHDLDGSSTDAGYFEFLGQETTDDANFAATLWPAHMNTWGHSIKPGLNHLVLQPGAVGVELRLDDDPYWTPPMEVQTFGARGIAWTPIDGLSGDALAVAPDCTYAVGYTYENEAIEWKGPDLPVAQGVKSGAIVFDQAEAMSVRMTSPRWESGKPGMTVKLAFYNWPAGREVILFGYSVSPNYPAAKRWTLTTSGAVLMTKSIQVPATAAAGYKYRVHVETSDKPLVLFLNPQVATLKSSKASIYRGGSFRLSGVVPVKDRWGSAPGRPKYVTLYKRTVSAGQPAMWDATRSGWTKVGTYKADGYGKYRTGLFSPKRTTWYIVRYPGDAEYQRGFTSVLKVPVK